MCAMTEKLRMRLGSMHPDRANYPLYRVRSPHPPNATTHDNLRAFESSWLPLLNPIYLDATGRYRCGYSGPMYSARGRIRRLLAYCSSTCAVQPEIRLTAKIGVNRSTGMPSAW